MPLESDNFCLTKCNGACCRNITMGLSQEELSRFSASSHATPITTSEMILEQFVERKYTAPGVYYSPTLHSDGRFIAIINGQCPNLDATGMCKVYESRPNACRRLLVGGNQCEIARKKEGLLASQVIPLSSVKRRT